MAEDTSNNDKEKTKEFSVGDHIFRWCSYLGVPFAYQQHAIVLAVETNSSSKEDEEDGSVLIILNFDHQEEVEESRSSSKDEAETQPQEQQGTFNSSSSSGSKSTSSEDNENDADAENEPNASNHNTSHSEPIKHETVNNREETDNAADAPISCSKMMKIQKLSLQKAREAPHSWERVQYSQSWTTRLLSRAGTCAEIAPDPVPVIMARIQFLQSHKNNNNLLSNLVYHPHKSNGECLARWCVTGDYGSAQGSAKMGEVGMHVGSFSVVGGIASQVVVSAFVPVVLPFLAAWDVGQAVYSAKEVHATRQEWQERSQLWNELFLKDLEQFQQQKDGTMTKEKPPVTNEDP